MLLDLGHEVPFYQTQCSPHPEIDARLLLAMPIESTTQGRSGEPCGRLSKRERGFCLLVLLIVVGGYFGTNLAKNRLGRTLFGHDMQQYYATLRTIVFDQDFDYANEYFELGPHPEHLQVEKVKKTGLYRNKYGVGWALIAMVPYLLVHFFLWVGSLFGGTFSYTGYEAPYQIAATLAQVVAGGFGIIFIFLSLRRYLPRADSMAAGLFVLLGTPFLFYCIQDFHMVHAAGVFTVAFFVYLAILVAEDSRAQGWRIYRRWAIWGASAALMFVTRYTNVIFIVVAFYPLMAHLRRRDYHRRAMIGVCAAIIAGLPILILQFSMWRYLYGEWVVNSYGAQGEGFNWLRPEFLNYLFSSNHGLIFTAPAVLPAFVGLLMGLFRTPAGMPRPLLASLSAACLLLLYVNASWHQWYFGWGFGSRSYLEASAGLAFGLAIFLSQSGKWRRLAAYAYCMLGSVWTLWLMVLFAKGDLLSNGSTTFEQILERSWRILSGG